MGKIKDIFTGEHRRLAWFTVVATVVFIVMKLVGPGNTVIHWIEAKREIARQERQMDEYRQHLIAYQATMSIVRQMLDRGIITEEEYHKIDTIIAKRHSISLCSIFR